uniref:Uncharacterized protein n=1 Tax=Anguilla anguilla TaxID=7936 RepID=A0A0E9TF21_ANGAN
MHPMAVLLIHTHSVLCTINVQKPMPCAVKNYRQMPHAVNAYSPNILSY